MLPNILSAYVLYYCVFIRYTDCKISEISLIWFTYCSEALIGTRNVFVTLNFYSLKALLISTEVNRFCRRQAIGANILLNKRNQHARCQVQWNYKFISLLRLFQDPVDQKHSVWFQSLNLSSVHFPLGAFYHLLLWPCASNVSQTSRKTKNVSSNTQTTAGLLSPFWF